MTYLDELVALMRTCTCGAGYADTRDGARRHAKVFGHWPRLAPDPEPPAALAHDEGLDQDVIVDD